MTPKNNFEKLESTFTSLDQRRYPLAVKLMLHRILYSPIKDCDVSS